MNAAKDARAAVAELGSTEELNGWFRDRVRSFGIVTHAFGLLDDAGATHFLLLNWPRAWLELYAARGYAREDCTIAHALDDPAPFTWAEIRARQPGVSERVFAAAAEFGWRDGLVVPVHGPGPVRGLAVLAGAVLDFTTAKRDAAVLLTLVAFERALELAGRRAAQDVALTRRERTALALVAAGHTDGEIGEEIGVTRATAHFHVESAKRRLGAATRAQAVAMALTSGLI